MGPNGHFFEFSPNKYFHCNIKQGSGIKNFMLQPLGTSDLSEKFHFYNISISRGSVSQLNYILVYFDSTFYYQFSTKKCFDFAHVNLLKCVFLLKPRVKYDCGFKFGTEVKFCIEWCTGGILFNSNWLDSELIPKLLENFENWKNFMIILFNVKNDA